MNKLPLSLNSPLNFLVPIKNSHFACICISKSMPKPKKTVSGEKKKSLEDENNSSKKGAIFLNMKNEVILKIHAKPGAKESAITDVGEESVGVQIAAPPVDGEANKELLRFLSKVLQLKKSDLCLDKGSRSKEKTVVISDSTLEDVLSKITAASKQ